MVDCLPGFFLLVGFPKLFGCFLEAMGLMQEFLALSVQFLQLFISGIDLEPLLGELVCIIRMVQLKLECTRSLVRPPICGIVLYVLESAV